MSESKVHAQGGWLMVKWIVILLVIVAGLYFFAYPEYTRRQEMEKADGGDVTCLGGCDSPEAHARFLKENSGEAADSSTEQPLDSARGAAEKSDSAGLASSSNPNAGSPTATPGTSAMVAPEAPSSAYPPSASNAAVDAPVVGPTTIQPGAMPVGLPPGLPTRDSESPNAPNGLRFAGSGAYQWYRQGNITWRVDTTTGRSCIIYATMEEWRKQIVMSHGCGRTA
jgi:hypothetical protein